MGSFCTCTDASLPPLRQARPLPSTLLPSPHFTLASLMLAVGISALRAGQSESVVAHQTVATLNATFACVLLLGTLMAPKSLGSPFTLLAAIQDVGWAIAMMRAGQWTVAEMMGTTKVGEALEETRQRGRQALDKAKQDTQTKMDQVKDAGNQTIDKAKQVGGETVDTVRSSVGKTVGDQSREVRTDRPSRTHTQIKAAGMC